MLTVTNAQQESFMKLLKLKTKGNNIGDRFKRIPHSLLYEELKNGPGKADKSEGTVVVTKTGLDMFCSFKLDNKLGESFLKGTPLPYNWSFSFAVHNSNYGRKAISLWLGISGIDYPWNIVISQGILDSTRHTLNAKVKDIVESITECLESVKTKVEFKAEVNRMHELVLGNKFYSELAWTYGNLLPRYRLPRSDIFDMVYRIDQYQGDMDKVTAFNVLCAAGTTISASPPLQQLPALIHATRLFGKSNINWY
jgi:hypothetical protein